MGGPQRSARTRKISRPRPKDQPCACGISQTIRLLFQSTFFYFNCWRQCCHRSKQRDMTLCLRPQADGYALVTKPKDWRNVSWIMQANAQSSATEFGKGWRRARTGRPGRIAGQRRLRWCFQSIRPIPFGSDCRRVSRQIQSCVDRKQRTWTCYLPQARTWIGA